MDTATILETKTYTKFQHNFTYEQLLEKNQLIKDQKEAGAGDITEAIRTELDGFLWDEFYKDRSFGMCSDLGSKGSTNFGMLERHVRADKLAEVFEPVSLPHKVGLWEGDFEAEQITGGTIQFYKDIPLFTCNGEYATPNYDYVRPKDMPIPPEWVFARLAKNLKGLEFETDNPDDRWTHKKYRASLPQFPKTALELYKRAQEISDCGPSRFYLIYKPNWEQFVIPILDPILLLKYPVCHTSGGYFDGVRGCEVPFEMVNSIWFKVAQWGGDEMTPKGEVS